MSLWIRSFVTARRVAVTGATLALVGMAASGCSDSSSPGGGGGSTTIFTGIVTGDNGTEGGSLTVTASTTTPAPPALVSQSVPGDVNATGTFKIQGGATVNLTGTYNTTSHTLSITGGGYTFTGVFDAVDRLEGTYTGPNGGGTFVSSKSSTAKAYCGTYVTDDQSDNGLFSIVVNGTKVSGGAVSVSDPTPIPLDGTATGNSISIVNPQNPQAVLATGTISGTSVSGTFDTGAGGAGSTGTWTGSECQ